MKTGPAAVFVNHSGRKVSPTPFLALLLCFQAGALRADVVTLRSGRMYAGHIEETTSLSVKLYDGNFRRVFSSGDIKEVINERPDTSWVIVGDRMVAQRDWNAAGEAYRRSLEITDQPNVVLRRLERLRNFRFEVAGAGEAESLLASGDYEGAARALFNVVAAAETAAQRHYWTNRLARAYAGLASQRTVNAEAEVDPYLVYALAIAPTCGAAHTLLGERLAASGHSSTAQAEFLLALDLDPLEERARTRLAEMGKPWSHDPQQTDRSGLREQVERLAPLSPEGDEAPLTTAGLARVIQHRVGRLDGQPARLLIAAYLLDPTAALAYEGIPPYPGLKPMISEILQETATPSPDKTPSDTTIIGKALAVRIDPRFVRAVAKVRTGHTVDHVAPDGNRGLIPLNRQRWESARRAANVDWSFEQDALDPEKNIELACRYFDWLRRVVLKPYLGNRLDRLERIHDNL